MTTPSRARMTPTDAPEPTPAVEAGAGALCECSCRSPIDPNFEGPEEDCPSHGRPESSARAVLTAALDVEDIARVLWINAERPTHGITEHQRYLARAIVKRLVGSAQ